MNSSEMFEEASRVLIVGRVIEPVEGLTGGRRDLIDGREVLGLVGVVGLLETFVTEMLLDLLIVSLKTPLLPRFLLPG
jgi:hypothetical protein